MISSKNSKSDILIGRIVATWSERIVTRLLSYEKCLHTLTLSCCMGIYIAFSPFVGFHTAMVFLFAWMFALNFAVMLSVSMLVNNPWTMVPVYGAGHWFGDWLLSLWGVEHHAWNPSWIVSMNSWARETMGFSGFSFWGFMIGGNILGVGLGILCYPMFKRFFAAVKKQSKKKVMQTVTKSKQVAHSFARKAGPILKRVQQRVKPGKEHENSRTK